ncbi:hypothetical protein HMPREF0322_02924 [Desulfitobacterium hafniense DP7]|uniref:Uncharacterized protein n=1 Tax=Desulfitobacterium hafniense DP7 TaxID=537010 RepID=G9XPM8_DESHA|nr:hypothetical protein HMPREF0322_02924 [Desulfitobacterium hafniense DP7]
MIGPNRLKVIVHWSSLKKTLLYLMHFSNDWAYRGDNSLLMLNFEWNFVFPLKENVIVLFSNSMFVALAEKAA